MFARNRQVAQLTNLIGRKILGGILATKLVEGFFILLTAASLVRFIGAPTAEAAALTFGFFAGRIICAGLTEKFFARLSTKVQDEFRRRIHAQIFGREISSGEF